MKKFNIQAIAIGLAMLGSALSAHAVPAMKGIHRWQQADGTTVNVQLKGDEHHSFYLSEDNYVLLDNEGIFYFAEMTDDGELAPSQWRATDLDKRSPQLNSFLSTLSKDDILQSVEVAGSNIREGMRRGPGLFSRNNFPATGKRRALVILVDFPNRSFSVDNPKNFFTRMLNEEGFSDYYGNGSARDYFIDNSLGQFEPTFDVYGPVTMPNNYEFYGQNGSRGGDANVGDMIITACQRLDSSINYANYDTNNDGLIDFVFVIYAGWGEASSTDPNTIWPHASQINGYTFDGKVLERYACCNEWMGPYPPATGGYPFGLGTFCHEFSHILGLPDLYATNYPTPEPFTPGVCDIMSGGSYNNYGYTPPCYSSFQRFALDWIQPEQISGSMNATLYPLASTGQAYKINCTRNGEFYLLENRQTTGWDRYLPGHGMYIWHIDYYPSYFDSNTVNNTYIHQYVDIVEADNEQTEDTRSGDPFPGTAGITSWTDNTTPSMKTWTGASLNLPLTEIKENAPYGTITFKVSGGAAPLPSVSVKAATNVTPRSFTANWNRYDANSHYLLYVYSKDGSGTPDYVPGYNGRNVTNHTSFAVTGLEPSKTYYYNVVVTNETSSSAPSAEMSVTTPALTHEYVIPTALAATSVGENEFTANWEPVDGANSYEVTVTNRYLSNTVTEFEGFDDKIPSWFTNSNTFYTSAVYAGASVPSLRLDNGQYVCSPYADGPVRSFSFVHRANKSKNDCILLVDAYVNDCWVPLMSIPVSKTRKVTNTINFFPEGTESVRVSYIDPTNSGMAYVDDLTMVWGGTATGGVVKVSNTSGTSVTIPDLKSGTEHFYTVKAIKNNVKSMSSNEVYVLTKGSTGIDCIGADEAAKAGITVEGSTLVITSPAEADAIVSDLSGRVLYSGVACEVATRINLASGIYVVRVGNVTTKVIVK